MWTTAFKNNSVHAFHTLTLYTPDEFLEGAIELAHEEHCCQALVPLFGKKYTYDARKEMVENLHPCSFGKTCKKCQMVKKSLLQYLT